MRLNFNPRPDRSAGTCFAAVSVGSRLSSPRQVSNPALNPCSRQITRLGMLKLGGEPAADRTVRYLSLLTAQCNQFPTPYFVLWTDTVTVTNLFLRRHNLTLMTIVFRLHVSYRSAMWTNRK